MMTRCSFDILLMHLFMTNVITIILFLLQPLLVYFILCIVIIRYMTGEAVVLKLLVLCCQPSSSVWIIVEEPACQHLLFLCADPEGWGGGGRGSRPPEKSQKYRVF